MNTTEDPIEEGTDETYMSNIDKNMYSNFVVRRDGIMRRWDWEVSQRAATLALHVSGHTVIGWENYMQSELSILRLFAEKQFDDFTIIPTIEVLIDIDFFCLLLSRITMPEAIEDAKEVRELFLDLRAELTGILELPAPEKFTEVSETASPPKYPSAIIIYEN